MIKLKWLLLMIFTFTTVLTYGQGEKLEKTIVDTTSISFRDTISNIAVDSLSNNLGQIEIALTNFPNQLVKYFKYIGIEPIFITRAWSGDPHFICKHPKEQLIPNKIYSFTVCIFPYPGFMCKTMGFDLSDGNRISFMFTGHVSIIEKKK
jgi:hypothetical protein